MIDWFSTVIFVCDNKEYSTFFLMPNFLMGLPVAQLAEALHYKPEGRGFDSRL